MDMPVFSAKLISLRQSQGLSQADFSRLLGKNQAIISRLESGSGPQPGLRTIKQIADFFSVSIDSLLQETDVILQRRDTFLLLARLTSDPFWADVLQNIPSDAAVYGYLIVSGFPKSTAREIACPDGERTIEDLDTEALPVTTRAMVFGGVNRFWMTQVCREIADEKENKPGDRLAAVKLAAELSGFMRDTDEDGNRDKDSLYASRTTITESDGKQSLYETIRAKISSLGVGSGLIVGSAITATQEAVEDPDLE